MSRYLIILNVLNNFFTFLQVVLELSKLQNENSSRNCTDYELNELKKTLRSNEKYIEELTINLRKKQIEINTLENDQVKMNAANQKIKVFINQKKI